MIKWLKDKITKAWQWFKRHRFKLATKAMSTFVLIGFPFSMWTVYVLFIGGSPVMATLWFMWAFITAAIPLYVAMNAEERYA